MADKLVSSRTKRDQSDQPTLTLIFHALEAHTLQKSASQVLNESNFYWDRGRLARHRVRSAGPREVLMFLFMESSELESYFPLRRER